MQRVLCSLVRRRKAMFPAIVVTKSVAFLIAIDARPTFGADVR